MDLQEIYRKSTLDFFSAPINELLKHYDQLLFDRADKANTNEEQNRNFESMREFRAKAPELEKRFNAFLSNGLEEFFQGNDQTFEAFNHSPDQLSLIDKKDLEDELAVNIISLRANSNFAEELWKLNRRLAVVRGGKKVEDHCNPCGPAHVSQALRFASQVLDVDSQTKMDLYQLFDDDVLAKAGELYQKMNALLSEKRILPNLTFQVGAAGASQTETARSPERSAGVPEATTVSAKGRTAHEAPRPVIQPVAASEWTSATEEKHQQELIKAIRGLQEQVGTARPVTTGGVDYGSMLAAQGQEEATFSENDFAFVLSALQQKLNLPKAGGIRKARTVETVEKNFVEQLTKLSEGNDRNKIAQDDAKIIEIVGMLFNYVLDDPKLSDAVKALISHMHTPMLKVALIDKGFFNKAGHPARRFLNVLSEIGARWVTEEDEDRMVLAKLKAMVARILDEFVDDLSIFDELYEEITQFATTLQERAARIEKRQAESHKGLEKLAIARQRSSNEILTRLEGQNVPDEVIKLLREPWTDFLAFVFLRHSDDSAIWRSSVKAIDGILWSVQVNRIRRNIDSFIVVRDKLQVTLQRGLKVIGYENNTANRLLTELARLQEAAYEQARIERDDASGEALPPREIAESDSDDFEPVPSEQATSAELPIVNEDAQSQETNERKKRTAINAQVSKINGNGNSAAASAQQEAPEQEVPEQEAPERSFRSESAQERRVRRQSAIDRQMALHQANTDLDEETAEILNNLSSLEFGTWFEFQEDGRSQPLLLKLAWYSKVSDHYMFVNNSGVKTAVKTQLEFAAGLSAGTINRVEADGKSFMERALESIARKIKPAA